MEKTAYDYIAEFYEHIERLKDELYCTVIGCGRRECATCEFCALCNELFELEIQINWLSHNSENIDNEEE